MQKILIGVGVIILLAVGFVVFVIVNLNTLVKDGIETVGPEVLGVPVTVDSVDISLLGGNGTISGLRIANPEGYRSLYAFELGNISFITGDIITADRIHLAVVIVESPTITYEGDLSDSNIQELQRRAVASASGSSGDGGAAGEGGDEGTPIRIDHLEINNASLFVDVALLEKQYDLVVPRVVVNDIGKEGEATPADVLVQVIREINRAALPLIRDKATDLDNIKETVKGGLDKLKSLFNR